MDNVAAALLDRLADKVFADMEQEERLAFVEDLFTGLPPEAQQAFLLKLVAQIEGDALPAAFASEHGEPRIIQVIRLGPEDFGPWQMCCQAMSGLVESADPERAEIPDMARMFTGLADETRLRIIKLLSEGERTVDELVGQLGVAQSTTSHHLRVLKEAQLIQGEKRGRRTFYALVHPLEPE